MSKIDELREDVGQLENEIAYIQLKVKEHPSCALCKARLEALLIDVSDAQYALDELIYQQKDQSNENE
jgi:hypothetical protein